MFWIISYLGWYYIKVCAVFELGQIITSAVSFVQMKNLIFLVKGMFFVKIAQMLGLLYQMKRVLGVLAYVGQINPKIGSDKERVYSSWC